jgi:NTP pyrophosphatase (non-canonical NTP hydrolase)
MDFTDYQMRAAATDQRPLEAETANRSDDALVMPLLGIGGELGTLHAAYKKYLRDGEAYEPFADHVGEELGDILWYVSNLASKFDLSLADIAERNLRKLAGRWGPLPAPRREEDLFDAGWPADEQLPRQFEVTFGPVTEEEPGPEPKMQATWQGKAFGDPLGNNAYEDDGYRFHDVFHLAHAAVLGWSPVCRRDRQFDCKRRSDRAVDVVEDGGRAIVTEEAIVAYVYGHARQHGYFADVDAIDFAVLKTINGLTAGFEAAAVSPRQWEQAILAGYAVWRQVREHGGGTVMGDMLEGTLVFRATADDPSAEAEVIPEGP